MNNQNYIFQFRSLIFYLLILLNIYSCISLFAQSHKTDSLRIALSLAKDDTHKVNHLNNLGRQLRNNNHDTSIILSNQALTLARKLKWKKGIANSLGNLGVYFKNQGDFPKALHFYFMALEIGNELGNKKIITSNHGNIGIVYDKQGDFPKALEHHFKALEIAQEFGDKNEIARHICNIGIVYAEQGDYPKALEHYFKAFEISKELGNKIFIVNNFCNIGVVYKNKGDYPKALDYFFKALEIFQDLGDKRTTATILGNIGIVYNRQGDYPKASEHYFNALEIAQELGDKSEIARHLGNIGVLYISHKRYAVAEDFLNKSLALAEEIGSIEIIKDQYQNLSKIFWKCAMDNEQLSKKSQNFEKAFYHYQKYLQAKDTLFNKEKSETMGKLEARHEFALIEMEVARKQKEKQVAVVAAVKRRDKIQFTGLTAVLIVIVLIVALVLFSKFNIAPGIKTGSLFIALILLFEFMLVWFDPAIEKFTGGNPAYKLFINALLAIGFYFVQQTLVKFLPVTVKPSAVKVNTIGILIICVYSFVHLCGFSFVSLVVKEENLTTKNTKNFTKDTKRDSLFLSHNNAKNFAKDEKGDSLKLLLSDYQNQFTIFRSQKKNKEAFETLKKYGGIKDTLQKLEQSQEESKIMERQAMEIQKKKQKQEADEKAKKEKEKKERKNQLIYSIILISIIFLFIVFSVTGRIRKGKFAVPQRVLEGGLFVSFLLFFEFVLVFADPYTEQFTGGAPAWKFGFNVTIAALIFPVHGFFEKLLRRVL